MKRRFLRLALVLGALAAPMTALAEPPPDVTGIWGLFQNGEIRLEWNGVEADNIDIYRMYYGQQSILENEGAFDDFIATAGKNNSFTITELPPYPRVFLGVIAVNTDGEESESFVEEIELDLSIGDTDGIRREFTAPSPSRKEREASQQALLSAESRSPTEVVLNFSAPVRIAPEQVGDAFTIIDETGQALRIHSATLQESVAVLTTDGQVPQRRYGVRVTPVVSGQHEGGDVLPLDPGRSIVDFTGYGEVPPPGQPGVAVPAGEMAPGGENGIRNIRTRFDPDGGGRFTVIVGWDAPSAGEAASYAVTPISGNITGKTSTVPGASRVVRFQRIPAGLFRVIIQPVAADGGIGTSVIAAVDVGIRSGAAMPRAAGATSVARPGGQLSSTGVGTLGIAVAAGAFAGWRRARRKGVL